MSQRPGPLLVESVPNPPTPDDGRARRAGEHGGRAPDRRRLVLTRAAFVAVVVAALLHSAGALWIWPHARVGFWTSTILDVVLPAAAGVAAVIRAGCSSPEGAGRAGSSSVPEPVPTRWG